MSDQTDKEATQPEETKDTLDLLVEKLQNITNDQASPSTTTPSRL